MKKLLKVILTVCLFAVLAVSLIACGNQPTKGGVCKVTFSQEGQEDIVFEVKKGEALPVENIPTPVQKEGYTVTWEAKDLTKVMTNLLVRAVEVPNLYVITFDAGEGTVEVEQKEVLFNSELTLPVAEREHYIFVGWQIEGAQDLFDEARYAIASNVTLVAVWMIDESDDYWSKDY